MIGKVTEYDSKRGFGFINGDQNKRIFVHYTAIKITPQKLKVGSKVTFQVARGARGPQAVKVRPLSSLH